MAEKNKEEIFNRNMTIGVTTVVALLIGWGLFKPAPKVHVVHLYDSKESVLKLIDAPQEEILVDGYYDTYRYHPGRWARFCNPFSDIELKFYKGQLCGAKNLPNNVMVR